MRELVIFFFAFLMALTSAWNCCDAAKIENFTLINADTDESIRTLADGDIINLATLPTRKLNIRANTNPAVIGSVEFELNAMTYSVENLAPYALAGDSPPGNYAPWTPTPGQYALTATPFSENRAQGEVGESLTVDFSVLDQPTDNEPPVAIDDFYTTEEDTSCNVAAPGVLSNDTDKDGDSLTATLVSDVNHGSLILNFDGRFSYEPDTGYTGADKFTYRANDYTEESNLATVSIAVMSGQLVVESFSLINADTDESIRTLADGDIINLATLPTRKLNIRANTNPAVIGSVEFELNAMTYSVENLAPYALAGDSPPGNYAPWTPTPGQYALTATPFSENRAQGEVGESLTVDFSVLDQPTDNEPPVAIDDFYTTEEDTSCNVAAPGVLSNDTDKDGDSLTATLVSDVNHGSLILNFDGRFSYEPDTGYTGADKFTYRANDYTEESNLATVSIAVMSGQLVVESFSLINADTDESIRTLADGDIINLATLPTRKLNIRANTNPAVIGSVEFELNAMTYSVENLAPYALAGDSPPGNYAPWTPTPGQYALTATPFSENRAQGEVGESLTVDFSVLDQPTDNEPPVAIFTASPISGYAPMEVNFNASDSFDPDGTIVKYAWDFDDYSNVVFPIDTWEQSSPESQGVDSVKLEQALNYIKDNTGNDGIKEAVVVRNGYVIWKGENTNKSHDVWSVTKVFTSSVLGLLVDDGTVTVNSKARNFVPDLTDLYPEVTLHHFATFTSGYDAEGYSDWGKDPNDSFGDGSNNPWMPTFPLFSPGSAFAYWDDAANMEAHVLTRIAQEPIYDLFKRRIGDIIGMNTDNWGWKNFGIVDEITLNGGAGSNNAGVYTSALELAKLGHLYLNRGKWDGTEILSAAWIERATQNQVSRFIPLADTKGTYLDGRGIYGYHWWTNDIKPDSNRNMPDAPIGTYYVTGHNDNFLVIVPEWNLVFVRLGLDETIPANEHSVYLNEFLKILGEGITSANSIGEEVSHTYTTPGSYIVSLSVTDDDSATNVTNQTITVTLN